MENKITHDLAGTRHTFVTHDKPEFNAPHQYNVWAATNDGEVTNLQEVNFQKGPVGEYGLNGLFNEDLIHMVINRLEHFQKSDFSCRENAVAITKLEEALMWLGNRTQGRHNRGVLGTSDK